MVHGENFYTFTIVQHKSNHHIATIGIFDKHVHSLYQQALQAHKQVAETYGFSRGATPISYIEQTYRPHILEHLKELFFTHCVLNFLSQSLADHKIVIVGDPTLLDARIEASNHALFLFGLPRVSAEFDDRWKKLSFKAPERKNYKDLDRQVETFIREETQNFENYVSTGIDIGDWVCFDLQLIDQNGNGLLEGYKDQLWVKLSDEEPDREIKELLYGKKAGDTFQTKSPYLQEYVSGDVKITYTFLIHIKHHIPNAYFSLELFKKHFQIKTAKELHLKLIEVFSTRNDLSQRRETVELALKMLTKQYYISIPSNLLERQRQLVLEAVHANPDYHVYKAQPDFKEKIRMLAEKQLKEMIIIDTIGYQENIKVTEKDLFTYLNLMNRARTREFIYFKLPLTKHNGQEVPISTELLKQYCFREKTLNHVINHLAKKTK